MEALTEALAWYVSVIHPLSIALALGLPCIRVFIRFRQKSEFDKELDPPPPPVFDNKTAFHDFANGLVFPTFVALVFMPMLPDGVLPARLLRCRDGSLPYAPSLRSLGAVPMRIVRQNLLKFDHHTSSYGLMNRFRAASTSSSVRIS